MASSEDDLFLHASEAMSRRMGEAGLRRAVCESRTEKLFVPIGNKITNLKNQREMRERERAHNGEEAYESFIAQCEFYCLISPTVLCDDTLKIIEI